MLQACVVYLIRPISLTVTYTHIPEELPPPPPPPLLQAAAVDLLAPVCGEVAGGSLREERPEILHRKLER